MLARQAERSIDLIVTDPPYRFDRGGTSGHFASWFPELSDEEWPAIFLQLYRVLESPGHAYVFSDSRVKPIFDAAAAAAGFAIRTPLVWDKQSIGLAGAGAAWRAQYELVSWYAKGPTLPVARSNRGNVLRHPRVRGYPTEKPIPVLEQIISQASSSGGIVLDPFCGSGNVGRAARRLGRRALLIDISTTAAANRLRVEPLSSR